MKIETEAEFRSGLLTGVDLLVTWVTAMAFMLPPSTQKDRLVSVTLAITEHIDNCRAYIADNGAGNQRRWECEKCGSEMVKATAIEQTYEGGLIGCLKCEKCGYSVRVL